MDVHDERIPAGRYAAFQRSLPEACVELFVEHDGAALLLRRTNEPAKGRWFWPGGRLYKGEELEAAAHRVARTELGIAVELIDQLGVYSHFWDTSALDGVESRHTVNVVYRAEPAEEPFDLRLDDQHDDCRFVSTVEPDLHPYVRRYLSDAGYPDGS